MTSQVVNILDFTQMLVAQKFWPSKTSTWHVRKGTRSSAIALLVRLGVSL